MLHNIRRLLPPPPSIDVPRRGFLLAARVSCSSKYLNSMPMAKSSPGSDIGRQSTHISTQHIGSMARQRLVQRVTRRFGSKKGWSWCLTAKGQPAILNLATLELLAVWRHNAVGCTSKKQESLPNNHVETQPSILFQHDALLGLTCMHSLTYGHHLMALKPPADMVRFSRVGKD